MLGVIIGIVLLLLLIGLVVLQGMIEWGNFDADKIFKKKEEKTGPAKGLKGAKPSGKKPVSQTPKKTVKKGKGKK